MAETLVLQLSNNFRDKCRVYLNECLDELTQRYELFHRHALEELLRDCFSIMANSRTSFEQNHHAGSSCFANHEVDTDCVKGDLHAAPTSHFGHDLVLKPKLERCLSISSGCATSPPAPSTWNLEASAQSSYEGLPLTVEEENMTSEETPGRSEGEAKCAAVDEDEEEEVTLTAVTEQYSSNSRGTGDRLRLMRAFFTNRNVGSLDVDCTTAKRASKTLSKVAARPRMKAVKRHSPQGVAPRRRYGKVDTEIRATISSIIGANPAISVVGINAELRRRLPHSSPVSKSYLGNVCRGLFYAVERSDVEAESCDAAEALRNRRCYARWFTANAGDSAQRIIFIDEWLYNVFSRRGAATSCGAGDDTSLLLALSAERGLELHRVARGAASEAALKTFALTLVTCEPCAFVLGHRLRHRAAVLARALKRPVQVLPSDCASLSPLHAAHAEWKSVMLRRLSCRSVQSLLLDMQRAPTQSVAAAVELRTQVLRGHAETALATITASLVAEWLAECREQCVVEAAEEL